MVARLCFVSKCLLFKSNVFKFPYDSDIIIRLDSIWFSQKQFHTYISFFEIAFPAKPSYQNTNYSWMEYLIILFLSEEAPEVPLIQYVKFKSKDPYDWSVIDECIRRDDIQSRFYRFRIDDSTLTSFSSMGCELKEESVIRLPFQS